MIQSWTIGAHPDCDLVVELPFVSGRHCRLILEQEGYRLVDLQSSNGTYVNGDRITESVPISASDTVTLGRTTRMPWPADAPVSAVLRLGRDADNDLVIAAPIVSGHHARVVWEGKSGEAMIEDLGSANGTSVGSPDRKTARASFGPGDLIYLGTHAISGSELLKRLVTLHVPAVAISSPRTERVSDSSEVDRSAAASPSIKGWLRDRPRLSARALGLMLQAPLLGLAICAIGWSSMPSRTGNRSGEASILFWTGLAALWFGLSHAIIGDRLGAKRSVEESASIPIWLGKLAKSSLLVILQCLTAWVIVASVFGLRGGWLVSLSLLILAAMIGLTLGQLIVSIDREPARRGAGLALVMVLFWAFGGGPQSLPRQALWTRTISNLMPSRWVFEGLLLVESPQTTALEPDSNRAPELAEPYFPLDSERMGTRADVMALVSIWLGLVAAATFVIGSSRRDPVKSSGP